jgi:hypothetical protein
MSADRFAAARAVADAVLYEGYILYPYRASARKNQLRWQFGVLVPQQQAALDHSERSSLRTECIVDPGDSPRLHVRVRCLQVQHRRVEEAVAGGRFRPAASLEVDDATWVEWDEAAEHELTIAEVDLLPTAHAVREVPVTLAAGATVDLLMTSAGALAGRAVRTRKAVDGLVRIETSWAEAPGAYLAVAVSVENVTEWWDPGATRDEVARHSLVAVHTLLAVDDGTFVSLLEPPDSAAAAAAGCRNDGTFPVLVGPRSDVMLSSPIILYDQPDIAPESVGDLFDATEIDEILGLRVLTLTDAEKAEARGTDARSADIIDRFEELPPEVWARLHGAVRSITPVAPQPEPTPWWDPDADAAIDPWTESVVVGGVEVAAGTKVVLRPGHRRADAHDIFLAGMTATVAGVFSDAEGQQHIAVTVDDDPATDELAWQGRYLFFHPDEVEVRESVER